MPESFDGYYQRILSEEATARWPAPLTEAFEPVSCIASDEKGEIFVVTRKADGAKGILRISKGEGAEDAKAEHEILSRLCDGRIPKALALFEEEGVSYLVREYMEGQTLKEYVKAHGAVPEKELIGIALDICGILSYLHGQTPPVIHRDIKPENIIIAPDGAIKLVDFGIARTHRADATSDTVAIGTPAPSHSWDRFMPPLPRSTGLRPAHCPPQGALVVQPSTARSARSRPIIVS